MKQLLIIVFLHISLASHSQTEGQGFSSIEEYEIFINIDSQ